MTFLTVFIFTVSLYFNPVTIKPKSYLDLLNEVNVASYEVKGSKYF